MSGYAEIFTSCAGLGLRQLGPGGASAAGLKRSVGFVLQPVENWSRYPEFAALLEFLPPLRAEDRVLDLGSPKMFGLRLALEHPARFLLTDLWPVAVEEVRELERRNRHRMRGHVELAVADLTDLSQFDDASFSHLFSMSVIEHIEDPEAIRRGLAEMSRVLRPGGVLVLSFPVAPTQREEYHEREVYGRRGERVFFSHYFDGDGARELLGSIGGCRVTRLRYSRWRTEQDWLRAWQRVPRTVRGALGVVNLGLAPYATEVRDLDPADPAAVPHEGDWIVRLLKSD